MKNLTLAGLVHEILFLRDSISVAMEDGHFQEAIDMCTLQMEELKELYERKSEWRIPDPVGVFKVQPRVTNI